MNLGIALRTLGERESGTARLEEAVAAYRAALEERTRARVPLAMGHDADRTSATRSGHSASARAARRGWRRRSRPSGRRWKNALARACRSQWARTQQNLGIALQTLGERESGTARLEEAVAAYRAALEENTRARVPLEWARTQQNLGTRSGHSASARAARRGWRRRSRPTGRRWKNALARACRSQWAHDADEPRQRAPDTRRARERHGAAGGGGRGLPGGAGRKHSRARAARNGPGRSRTSALRSGHSASARAARRGWRRRSRPTGRRWRNGPLSASHDGMNSHNVISQGRLRSYNDAKSRLALSGLSI